MNSPNRRVWVAVVWIFLAYAIGGTMDYKEARRVECAEQELSYNFWKDSCK